MSYHAINTTLTFTWAIRPLPDPPVKADFDIILILPDGTTTYTNDGITTYVAPTATAQGTVTYDLAVTSVGLHQVTLSIGENNDFVVHARREVYIVDPPSYITGGTPATTVRGPVVLK